MPSKNPQSASKNTEDDYVQLRGKLKTRILVLDGEARTLTEWSKITKLPDYVIILRIKNGWSVRDALMKPRVLRRVEKHINKLSNFAKSKFLVEPDTQEAQKLKAHKIDQETLVGLREAAYAARDMIEKMKPSDRRRALAQVFGENKVKACQRLHREQRYNRFRTLIARYKKELKPLVFDRTILFYLALQHFAPLPEDGI